MGIPEEGVGDSKGDNGGQKGEMGVPAGGGGSLEGKLEV